MAARRAPLPILLSEPDASLARRVGGGDDTAFEVLVARHGDALARFCRGLLRNQEDAEDALQATLMRAYRALGRAEGPASMRSWLLRIARNECLRVAGARAGTEPLRAEPAVEARLSERVQARDDLRVLGGDLRALPEHQRAAIVLREICGMSHRQAAEVIGVTPDAVRRLVHDARQSLESFGAGRELACLDVRRRIAGGDGRVMRARAVGAHLRACADCRAVARSRRPLAALLPPLPAAFAGRWLSAKLAAGGLAGAVVVSGALLVTGGLDVPAGGGAGAAAAHGAPAPAAAAPARAAAPQEVAVRTAAPAAKPAGTKPGSAADPAGPDPATPAPEPVGESVPAPAAPASPGPAAAGPATPSGPGPATGAGPAAQADAVPATTTVAAPAAPATGGAPIVTATVATPPAAATVSVGNGGVTAGAQVAAPALPPVPVLPALPPVTAAGQVSVSTAPASGAPVVRATVDPPLGLPALRVALP